MIIAKDEIITLLNEFYLNGIYRLKVSSPLFREIYSFELRKEPVVSAMTLDQYSEKYDSLRLKCVPEVAEEIPGPTEEYRWIFQSSGVLKPENYAEIVKELEDEADRDFMRGDKPLYVGFDTNALISRFPVIMPEVKCGFCLHCGTLKELHPRYIEEKIRGTKANVLKKYGFTEVLNQPPLKVRKFKVGAVEYRKLKRREYAEEIEGEPGDLSMIKDYQNFQRSRNADVLLISEDSNFVEVANDHRIKAIHVRQAKDIPNKLNPTWGELVELLYITAIAYGVIQVKSALIFGVWRGKTKDDWNSEHLKVEFKDGKLAAEMERNLRILKSCGRLKWR